MSEDRFARGERIQRRAVQRMIDTVRGGGRLRTWRDMTGLERAQWVAEQLRNFASEIDSAYREQRSGGANYRVSADDVCALWSIARWAEHDAALVEWRRDAQNDAAWQMFERYPDRLGDSERKRLDTAPKRPGKAKSEAPTGCPTLPTVDAPVPWEDLVGDFLKTRRGQRFNEGASDGE